MSVGTGAGEIITPGACLLSHRLMSNFTTKYTSQLGREVYVIQSAQISEAVDRRNGEGDK